MFICEQCGSQLWVSFSNNSGEPDGKNIQITHPGKPIEIVKVWLDAEGNVINRTGLSAKFTITWTGKDGVERSMNNVGPGKYFFPEDLIDSIVVKESGVTKNFTLIKINGVDVRSVSDLNVEKNKCSVGDRVKLTVWRDGKTLDFTVTLMDAAEFE